ncbi:MAG: hypothetical protein J7517_06405 [Sphingobium yanoikuyae]|uniref:hypothetical protein n=1 Tax=Sphingobium yanoikuyae TaxID=13690 RepID=UPI001B1439D9|nr:hypothetical protein [Sphingobium yanoikuyae]
MMAADYPMSEEQLVDMLLARNGQRTLVTTVNKEPMKVTSLEITDLHSDAEWDHYADIGGIGLVSDGGKYSFYSTEVGTVTNLISGALIYTRKPA